MCDDKVCVLSLDWSQVHNEHRTLSTERRRVKFLMSNNSIVLSLDGKNGVSITQPCTPKFSRIIARLEESQVHNNRKLFLLSVDSSHCFFLFFLSVSRIK